MTPSLLALAVPHFPILLIVGFALFAGGLGARLFQRLRIPQVVGYIVIGLVLGRSGVGFIDEQSIGSLRLFNFFALGVIGFMIGGELRLEVFRRYGRQFMKILFSEGLTAFVLVSLLVFGVGLAVGLEVLYATALALVLGAIASATAPAATVDVLWEYKTRGPLTTAVFAIVALDDGLALVLYAIASTVASNLIGEAESLLTTMGMTAYELFGAVALGIAAGAGLNFVLRIARDHDKALTFIIGTLGIVIGVAVAAGIDLILAAMTLGMTLVNLAPRRSRESFQIIERFAPPIYVLFFVVVGARLSVGEMQSWMWILAAAYVVGRTGGKMFGAFLGAKWANASAAVRNYLGLCLFSQAGVAIGLAILASESFRPISPDLANAVIMTVTATTFLVQIIGPPCVKLAVDRAGEVGLNITRDDLIESYKVRDVMDPKPATFFQGAPFPLIMRTISDTDAMTYPIVDEDRRLLGIITIQEFKSGLHSEGLADLLVAMDLMQPVIDTASADMPLHEALTRMNEQDLDYLPVVEPAEDEQPPKLLGLLERRQVDRLLSREVLRRREFADSHEKTQVARTAVAKRRNHE